MQLLNFEPLSPSDAAAVVIIKIFCLTLMIILLRWCCCVTTRATFTWHLTDLAGSLYLAHVVYPSVILYYMNVIIIIVVVVSSSLEICLEEDLKTWLEVGSMYRMINCLFKLVPFPVLIFFFTTAIHNPNVIIWLLLKQEVVVVIYRTTICLL